MKQFKILPIWQWTKKRNQFYFPRCDGASSSKVHKGLTNLMKSTNFIVSELHVIGNNIRQLTSRFFGSLQVWKYYNIYTLQLFLVGTKCSARSFFTLFLLMRVSFFVLDMYFTSANKPLLLETVSLNHCIV